MNLYLIRHATAEPKAETDAQRNLVPEGKEEAKIVGKGFKKLGIKPDVIFSSPLNRALQTAKVIAQTLKFENEVVIIPELENGHSSSELLEVIKKYDSQSSLFLIGHMPSLAEFLSDFIGASRPQAFPFDKGGVAAIRSEQLRLGIWELRFMLRQSQLRRY
ncbi:phosphohistidine phosphatase SixA [Candidatus Methylacidiphilum fumarolicum]|uniref:Phosphohistidine phosphatase SixA n=2 Tax=Candidatus Methylacidiphilum fumarolicum TaxID=591154 RepID=I0JYA2_METFB|nr:phosphohistidine phosphatase SixA [Candidatus Methylacidiphilum fumarolicum]MBW6415213.1 phosphohistidine phosphatase SixA [Candidatus Methylacidiphilum fumarolicum]TFE69822.1 phosphohistidine phosphatase SixA [Candidatus Methylacidiphilum fumarolicum]TFE71688.1 phosphohistidine phosphatase SixA [Candidatus Methylacidiphilum fumarolicum]TFE72606.1 phosphohistidine phosphatase SixA [Candidatus Methylacidiphilum fumarolicum]TFE76698.1 phosphohistidine phosphatase SixA [Candidatus Methylacidip